MKKNIVRLPQSKASKFNNQKPSKTFYENMRAIVDVMEHDAEEEYILIAVKNKDEDGDIQLGWMACPIDNLKEGWELDFTDSNGKIKQLAIK